MMRNKDEKVGLWVEWNVGLYIQGEERSWISIHFSFNATSQKQLNIKNSHSTGLLWYPETSLPTMPCTKAPIQLQHMHIEHDKTPALCAAPSKYAISTR